MVTVDTNIAFYALAEDGAKAARAKQVLAGINFLSVQVLNEFANAARRKMRREWAEVAHDLELLRSGVDRICEVNADANRLATDLAGRYQLNFYDALLVAVAVTNGATTLYSEDMHHGLVIDGKLTITNPFREPA